MEKIIDGVLMAAYLMLAVAGGRYTLHQVAEWSKYAALEKSAQGLGRLEPATQKMTGGRLDY